MKRRKRSVWKAGKKEGGKGVGRTLINNMLHNMEKAAVAEKKQKERLENIEKRLSNLGYPLTYDDGGEEKRLSDVVDKLLKQGGYTLTQLKRIETSIQSELAEARKREQAHQEILIQKRCGKIEKLLRKHDIPLQICKENGSPAAVSRIADRILSERNLSIRNFRQIEPELRKIACADGSAHISDEFEHEMQTGALAENVSLDTKSDCSMPSKRKGTFESVGLWQLFGIFLCVMSSLYLLPALVALPMAMSEGIVIGGITCFIILLPGVTVFYIGYRILKGKTKNKIPRVDPS